MDMITITLTLIKFAVIIESLLLSTYLFATYLLVTGSVKNGLAKALGLTFGTGMFYSITIIASLFLLITNYDKINNNDILHWLTYMFVAARTMVLFSRFNLGHELRIHAIESGVMIDKNG